MIELTFVIPFLANYAKMATALGRTVKHFHPDAELVALTTAPADETVRRVVRTAGFDDLVEYPPLDIDDGGYTSVIWTKLQAFSLDTDRTVLCLDADLMMYGPVDGLVEEYRRSGRQFASVLDPNPTLGLSFRQFDAELAPLASAPAPCGCFLIFDPDPALGTDLLATARRLNGRTHFAEQSALGYHAANHDGWLDLGERAVVQCRSPAVLTVPLPAPFLHVGAPRPAAFEANPVRWGELPYAEECELFAEATGVPFPEARLVADLEARYQGDFRGVG